MLKNNQFTSDVDADRLERLLTLTAHIDEHAVDLGLVAPNAILTWAQGADAAWESAVSSAIVEDGQMDDAFETYANKVSEVYSYYTGARELLMAFITENENPNDLAKAYGFEGDSSRTGKGLVIAISAWKDQHDFMVAEVLTPIINDTIMLQLLAYETELKSFLDNTKIEKEESRQAYKTKAALFSTDSKQLRILYQLAAFTFGDDDDRLGLLGFVPSSEVWTPGMPEPGIASFSDKPIAKIMKAPYPLNGISAGCEEYSGTTRFDYRIAWAQKGEGVPPMSEEDYMTDVEQPTLLDVELMFGYVYYEWIRARKDGEVSEWSDVASYEWNG